MEASGTHQKQTKPGKWPGLALDLIITLLLWAYYTVGFLFFFAPFYVLAYLFTRDTIRSFQRLNSFFYQVFFALVRVLIPACQWKIDAAVRDIRASVVVSNHISYLDPILLISLFGRHTTIAKARLFDIPLYGKMLVLSGYLPSNATGRLADLMLQRMAAMPDHLASGGNLIIFPEGTRSRQGGIGRLNKGAFKIARLCRAPIKVLCIRNTDNLFKPGRFLFDTQRPNRIRVELLETIDPDYEDSRFSIHTLVERVHTRLKQQDPAVEASCE